MDLRNTAFRAALRRVADAEAAAVRTEQALRSAALQVATRSESVSVLRELAGCEVRDRRARATAERARRALSALRADVLDQRRSVPARFRRRTDLERPDVVINLYGRPVTAEEATPSAPAATGDASPEPVRAAAARA